jgi:hypothetical protein
VDDLAAGDESLAMDLAEFCRVPYRRGTLLDWVEPEAYHD